MSVLHCLVQRAVHSAFLLTCFNHSMPLPAQLLFLLCTHRYKLRSLWLAERGYRTIVSSPVPLNLEDLTLDRAAGTHSADAAAALLARADAQRAEENGLVEEEEEEEEPQPEPEPSGGGGGSKPASRAGSMQDVSAAATAGSEAEGGALGERIWLGWVWCGVAGRQLVCCAAGASRVLCRAAPCCNLRLRQTGRHFSLPPPPPFPPAASALRKVYRPLYVWGQLSSWFKQTVNDPTASLSAERRGTASLPDLESAFAGGQARYSPKVGPAAASGEALFNCCCCGKSCSCNGLSDGLWIAQSAALHSHVA